MSELSIKLNWQLSGPSLSPGKYSNTHTVVYNDNYELLVDAAPDWGGDVNNTNPEQALAASLSSCQMMTFLALTAKAGWPVENYQDHAVAHLGKNSQGRMAIVRIDLRPVVGFKADFNVNDVDLEKMHNRAHRYCFIANTLADSVAINILG
ncbi:MAG: OsmC family protein [Gammaproteobacteria bacterium]|nr:OsmC family protein [Gammaproteobacteria bacterium]